MTTEHTYLRDWAELKEAFATAAADSSLPRDEPAKRFEEL